jgi:hypothetical protein
LAGEQKAKSPLQSVQTIKENSMSEFIISIIIGTTIIVIICIAFTDAIRNTLRAIKDIYMNRKKLIILWSGIFVIVAMCLFPPFVAKDGTVGYAQLFSREISIAYSSYDTREVDAHIDVVRLIIQCVIVGLITGALLYTLKDKKNEGSGK